MTKPRSITPVSESALMVYFADTVDISLPVSIGQYAMQLEQTFGDALLNCTPSYTSLLIEYHPLKVSELQIVQWLRTTDITELVGRDTYSLVTLPAYYSHEVGPELVSMSQTLSIPIERIIELHSQTTYTVCAIGFAPGFAFLAEVPAEIQVPRLVTPRAKVPKGSVGIASHQTAVYPSATPGGWQIIANCPISFYDPLAPQNSLLKVGDKVKFEPIDKQEYLKLGGQICQNWS
ncbi:5-oxoprolinase subunit B family protein [Vibrio hangzhouensis]|uniref:5-oxoprolinase subunit B family protein n=1 Tax=Vibrio hangzhouensis TaxID=462991 RepID=UPI001C95DCCE|nr:allophanate hydrolase subunit 1 [Vibrio hangzhouensis]MBY6197606.1 allophanate hydrolase subunit 1 [Vibrio hangzhouensis]